ncbi:hypothetical protein NDU88_000421 [Pleurodeles waltl]|uniref:Uncharacterized protein n=1 Tax=Pleurodeles waltl TaxID=8319 RepID=A0AAV7MGV3_PLEWA|nr:hypothetical protein NDU88_000421 [Pleurodeles waltl]
MSAVHSDQSAALILTTTVHNSQSDAGRAHVFGLCDNPRGRVLNPLHLSRGYFWAAGLLRAAVRPAANYSSCSGCKALAPEEGSKAAKDPPRL